MSGISTSTTSMSASASAPADIRGSPRTVCSRTSSSRAADRDDDVLEQTVRGEPRISAGAEADADIDVVEVEIPDIVGDVETQLDAWLLLAEIVDPPHQPFRRELRVE